MHHDVIPGDDRTDPRTDGAADDSPVARLPRRWFLGGALAAAVATGTASAETGTARTGGRVRRGARVRRRPRSVIFMVADGMSQGTWTLADLVSRARRGRPSTWARLMQRPGVRRALMHTASANSLVTDSAAAGTAWSTGGKVDNEVLNVWPDGRTPTPIFVRAASEGRPVGLVTTTEITHATPASFAVNVARRTDTAAVAAQLVERPIDVLLGGGASGMDPALPAASPAWQIVRTAEELAGVDAAAAAAGSGAGPRLVGVFAGGHLPYELDRPDTVPALTTMTDVALRRLSALSSARPDGPGFMLQIEGGRVDHAAHANDAASLVAEQLAFDDALERVLAFIGDRDDVLLVITTDHGNANPGLTYYTSKGEAAFGRFLDVRQSFVWMRRRIRAELQREAERAGVPGDASGGRNVADTIEPSRVEAVLRSAIRAGTNLTLSDDELGFLRRTLVEGERGSVFDPLASSTACLGQALAQHIGVSFMSTNHTSDAVEVTAIGPGSERLEGLIDNVDLHSVVTEAAGLRA